MLFKNELTVKRVGKCENDVNLSKGTVKNTYFSKGKVMRTKVYNTNCCLPIFITTMLQIFTKLRFLIKIKQLTQINDINSYSRLVHLTRRSVVNIRWYSDDDSSDDEKKKVKKHDPAKQKSEDAIKRLNDLLNSMSAPTLAKKANILTANNKRQKRRKKKSKKLQEKQEDPTNLE